MIYSIFWLALIAFMLLVEILTLGLFTIWLAIGALAAFAVSLLFENLFVEIVVFLLMSTALLTFVRPLAVNYMKPKRNKRNFSGVIGKFASVIIPIDNHMAVGKVSIEGQEWSARSLDGTVIGADTIVKVQGVSGINLLVSRSYKQKKQVEIFTAVSKDGR